MEQVAQPDEHGGGKAPVCYPGTNLPVLRFARSPQDDDQIAKLSTQVLQAIGRRAKAKIDAGRSLNELKKLLGHGHFISYFEETFAPSGLSLRTAERWMGKATTEDALENNDKMANSKIAGDQNAKERREAGKQAQKEADQEKPKEAPLYRLMLHLDEEEKAALDALRQSRYWNRAERHLVRWLRELCIKYKIVERDAWERS